METKDDKKLPLLLEGELLIEKNKGLGKSEIEIKILDVSRLDAKSEVLSELSEVVTLQKNQTTIPFKLFGPSPDASKKYIVVATISTEKEKGKKKTIYRTTQSIPVFNKESSKLVMVPLTNVS